MFICSSVFLSVCHRVTLCLCVYCKDMCHHLTCVCVFSVSLLVCLYVCMYAQARSEGTASCKWVLVNIQDTQEFASQVLNRDVWNNAEVKTAIRRNFIFWQVCVTHPLSLPFLEEMTHMLFLLLNCRRTASWTMPSNSSSSTTLTVFLTWPSLTLGLERTWHSGTASPCEAFLQLVGRVEQESNLCTTFACPSAQHPSGRNMQSGGGMGQDLHALGIKFVQVH